MRKANSKTNPEDTLRVPTNYTSLTTVNAGGTHSTVNAGGIHGYGSYTCMLTHGHYREYITQHGPLLPVALRLRHY